MCKHLNFWKEGLPDDVFIRGSSASNPSIIDREVLQAIQQPTPVPVIGLEIVPWKPVKDVIALQFLPIVLQCMQEAKKKLENAAPEPVILLGAPPRFEFQADHPRPSPSPNKGRKSRAAAGKKTLSLPSAISANSFTPLVQSSVRRSSRITANLDGFCPTVRLHGNPTKKRKIAVI